MKRISIVLIALFSTPLCSRNISVMARLARLQLFGTIAKRAPQLVKATHTTPAAMTAQATLPSYRNYTAIDPIKIHEIPVEDIERAAQTTHNFKQIVQAAWHEFIQYRSQRPVPHTVPLTSDLTAEEQLRIGYGRLAAAAIAPFCPNGAQIIDEVLNRVEQEPNTALRHALWMSDVPYEFDVATHLAQQAAAQLPVHQDTGQLFAILGEAAPAA